MRNRADQSDWARSFLGVCHSYCMSKEIADKQYPPVREAKPNPTHIYIAALSALGLAPNLITQNVSLLLTFQPGLQLMDR